MALSGLLAAASPILGVATGGIGTGVLSAAQGALGAAPPTETSSAQATVTTSTSLTSGSMTMGETSPWIILLFGLALYWAFKR